jgi:hypothetical protein
MLVRLRDEAAPTTVPTPDGEAEPAEIVSVIVPVMQDDDGGLTEAYRAYRAALEGASGRAQGGGRAVEFVYVLAGGTPRARAALGALKEAGEPLVLVLLSRSENEAAALRSGVQHARGETILTLSPYPQVEPDELPRLLEALAGCDMVVARRAQFAASTGDSFQVAVLHWLIRKLFGRTFGDLVCRVRACRRSVFEEIAGYGTQHHFLPLLATERGFRLREVEVRQHQDPASASRSSGLRARLRLTFDILALFVVLKFVRKPLRFFGTLGLPILLLGLGFTAWLAFERLVLGVGLADRPALVLGILLIVLGIQVIALGLIGEIIIFASGKRLKDYTVERIL